MAVDMFVIEDGILVKCNIKTKKGNSDIIIPENVREIGSSAFSGCRFLTSVTIPEGVKTIAESAFSGLESLASVALPEGVEEIGEDAFAGCVSLRTVGVPSLEAWLGMRFVSRHSNPLSCGAALVVAGERLVDLRIPEGVSEVGRFAFSGCPFLTSVTIPEGVKTIGEKAFLLCAYLASVALPESVEEIGKNAFEYCVSLRTVSVPSLGAWLGMRFVSEDSSPLRRGAALVVAGERLADLRIPEGVSEVGRFAFSHCASLTSVTIPEGVKTIGEEAFLCCGSLATVALPEGVEEIGYDAFIGCKSLRTVSVPSLGAWLGIRFVSERSNPLRYGADLVVAGERLADLRVPEGTEEIGRFSFSGCASLISVTIPEGVKTIDDGAFIGCKSLRTVSVPSLGAWLGIRFVSERSNPLRYGADLVVAGERLADLRVPEGTEEIGRFSFSGCASLISVTIPEGVKTIGDGAFIDCRSLASVALPEGVEEIGEEAFEYCKSLRTVGVPSLGAWLGIRFVSERSNPLGFGADLVVAGERLVDLRIPEGVSEVGRFAFSHCASLASVAIPEGVKTIGDGAFLFCMFLTSVALPEGVEEIGNDAFEYCTSLRTVDVPSLGAWLGIRFVSERSNPLGFGADLVVAGERLADLRIPEGVSEVGRFAFLRCASLSSVALPEEVREIGHHAFSSCKSLVSVKLSTGVRVIRTKAFAGCKSLVSITLPEGVEEVCPDAFDGCHSLERISVLVSILPRELVVGPNIPLVSSFLTVSDADGEHVQKASIAAGRILYAVENPGCGLDDATRKYVRSQLKKVCEVLRFDVAAMRFIAKNDLATDAGLAKLAAECEGRGFTEASEALRASSRAENGKAAKETKITLTIPQTVTLVLDALDEGDASKLPELERIANKVPMADCVELLEHAAANCDGAAIEKLYELFAPFECVSTALHVALFSGNVGTAKALLSHGANLNGSLKMVSEKRTPSSKLSARVKRYSHGLAGSTLNSRSVISDALTRWDGRITSRTKTESSESMFRWSDGTIYRTKLDDSWAAPVNNPSCENAANTVVAISGEKRFRKSIATKLLHNFISFQDSLTNCGNFDAAAARILLESGILSKEDIAGLPWKNATYAATYASRFGKGNQFEIIRFVHDFLPPETFLKFWSPRFAKPDQDTGEYKTIPELLLFVDVLTCDNCTNQTDVLKALTIAGELGALKKLANKQGWFTKRRINALVDIANQSDRKEIAG